MNKHISDRDRLIISMLIFGTIGLVRRLIPFPSSVIVFTRALIGLLFLLLLRMLRHEPTDRRAVRRNLGKLLLLGVMLAVNWITLFEAYRYTTVAAATMCYYMAPVIVIVTSPIIFKEKITLRKGLCALAAVCGMVLVSDVLTGGLHGTKGLLLGLAAAFLYASIIIVNRTLRDISALDRTIAQFAVASAVMLPYVLLTEDPGTLVFTPRVVCLLLLLGIVHTGFAYMLYFGSIPCVSAQTAALLSYLDPVLAVFLSVAVLRESMSLPAMIGAAIVIGSMLLSEWEPAKGQ